MSEKIKIVDCPRDAMQGIHDFIKTEDKIDHLTKLMKVGFDTIDCGSFVSPKIIPQMADTNEVLQAVKTVQTESKLSVIVASEGGAERALLHENVDFLGFPFSISEQFQFDNTNKSREEAFQSVQNIVNLLEGTSKELLLYFSMAFGNPYQEEWNVNLVKEWAARFSDIGIKMINLSDTTSVAHKEDVEELFKTLVPKYPEIEFGAHFHTEYLEWFTKVDAAYQNGCRKFDGAIKGFGGCPMAKSEMVGNMPTEKLITYAESVNADHGLNLFAFESAYNSAMRILG
ncbi:hydroxymethylglutaryl-CoA lyase [Moheibacter stercoris]|uniref:Hydroxymethylglutaryl-CoA lyase n=1 Tax=Moheibacter stercoris TaxID=1628251 RepID=A0ABV2LXB6_9FLAO